MFDAVVVGGGAAGLSGALTLARCRRRVLVVDDGTPRNAASGHLHGYLSRDGAAPAELIAAGHAEVVRHGGEFLADRAISARRLDAPPAEPVPAGEPALASMVFEVSFAQAPAVLARRLLVTTGLTDELPAVPGLAERFGRDVLHCPYCHGWEVRDQPLGVLATRADAAHHARLIRQWSADLVLFANDTGPFPAEDVARLTALGGSIADGPVAGLVVADDLLRGVRLADGTVIDRAALFVTPTFTARDDVLAALGAVTGEDDAASWVRTDAAGATSVPGVWAAGNVVDPSVQLIGAAAAGARAAVAINQHLIYGG